MRSTFFWRLYGGIVALILVSALVVGLWLEREARADLRRDLEESLAARTVLLAEIARPHLRERATAELEARVAELGRDSGARLTIVRADGAVLADSEKDPAAMDDHSRRPEIVEAARTGAGRAERASDTLGSPFLYVARAVREGDELVGFARAALPLAEIDERLASLRRTVIVTALLAVALAALLAASFARRVSAPLSAVTVLAEQIARGETHTVHRHEGTDEIRRLSEAMRTMTAQLEERLATITSDRNTVLAILSGLVEGLIALDRDERVVHWNAAAGRMLDVDPAQALGRKLWEVTRLQALRETLDAALSGARDASGEGRVAPTLPGRGDTVLEVRASPLRDANGQTSGAVIVLHDVTELRRLETVRRDFVANVSHELKTPLTAIRGMVETMLDDREMPAATRERFLERVREQSLRLSALVTDLLTLARVESSDGRPKLERRDVRGLLRECVQRFADLAARKSLALACELPVEPVELEVDDECLRQIVDNLLDNACKYTPGGGRVELSLRRDGEAVTIAVADNGIGIAASDQERVFERFYRVDKARSRELGGTGLGLSIVKHLAQSLGGRVALESQLGRGSTFSVRFPAPT